MSFAITEEQHALDAGLADMAEALMRKGEADWASLVVGYGLDGLGRGEADGGLGAGVREAAIVADVFGRNGVALPWTDHWVGARLAAGDAADRPDETWAHDARTILHSAEMIGLCGTMLADAIAFAKERRQFGVAIATFQVLRHRMVDMRIALEQASAITGYALELIDGAAGPRAKAVSAARVVAEDAVRIVGEGAVQIHGAMGLTEELRIGRFFRAARTLAQGDGTARAHLRRYADASRTAGAD